MSHIFTVAPWWVSKSAVGFCKCSVIIFFSKHNAVVVWRNVCTSAQPVLHQHLSNIFI
jgi:hypothetical protein